MIFVSLPRHTILKIPKLDAIEYEIMKSHSSIGYDILKDIPFTWPIAQAVYQHHERIDGSGYPNQLVGDAIIPEAKILAIADTIESMTSHRPYRPGLGLEKAILQVKSEAGKTLDPAICEVACQLIEQDEFQKIMASTE